MSWTIFFHARSHFGSHWYALQFMHVYAHRLAAIVHTAGMGCSISDARPVGELFRSGSQKRGTTFKLCGWSMLMTSGNLPVQGGRNTASSELDLCSTVPLRASRVMLTSLPPQSSCVATSNNFGRSAGAFPYSRACAGVHTYS